MLFLELLPEELLFIIIDHILEKDIIFFSNALNNDELIFYRYLKRKNYNFYKILLKVANNLDLTISEMVKYIITENGELLRTIIVLNIYDYTNYYKYLMYIFYRLSHTFYKQERNILLSDIMYSIHFNIKYPQLYDYYYDNYKKFVYFPNLYDFYEYRHRPKLLFAKYRINVPEYMIEDINKLVKQR